MKFATVLKAAAATLAAAAIALPAQAQQDWPNRTVKIVVAFTAGGTTDILARMIGQRFADKFRQPFVVDNKPGGAGNIVLVLLAFALLATPCYAARPATRVPSGLKVYDANRQFFGILVGLAPEAMSTVRYPVEPSFTVFIPSLSKFIEIKMDGFGSTDRFALDCLWFDVADCAGGAVYAYLENEDVVNPHYMTSFVEYDGTQRFFTSAGAQGIQLQSLRLSYEYQDSPIPTCQNISYEPGGYPLTEVTLPFTFPLQPRTKMPLHHLAL